MEQGQARRRSSDPASDGNAGPAADDADRVLVIARDLALELHPRRGGTLRVGWDSALDRDLGLDSLGRAELLLRLEHAFQVRLPERLLAEAGTLGDLLAAVQRAGPAIPLPEGSFRGLVLGPVEAAPGDARTWTEVLDWHVRRHPDRPHLLLPEGDGAGTEETITYGALAAEAQALARGLYGGGLEPGDRIALMLPTGRSFFIAFLGTLLAGAVPVPIYPPFRPAEIEAHLRRQAAILRNAEAVVLITTPEAHRVAALLRLHVPSLRRIETADRLRADGDGGIAAPTPGSEDVHVGPEDVHPGPEDVALLQYTSGSTGDPKGVVLSHANLLANVRAMGQAMGATSDDRVVSWLPLYHDMGLIGAWLGSLYHAIPAAILPPLSFLARPERWLWAIHRYRGTISAAPNFAFELCLRRIDDTALAGLDLSSLRFLANGAEPVIPETLRRFTARFAPHGFRAEAMAPVYGLAENAVGLAFPPPGRGPVVDRVRREPLRHRGEALPAGSGDTDGVEIVGCGHPLPEHEVRIVDATGREVGERREGRLQFRGPSATRGYFRDPVRTRALFAGAPSDGNWLDSGDLAYIDRGEIFLTGRVKDLIIRAGRNIHPHAVEAAVGAVPGVRRGGVAVFGSTDPAAGTESLVVLAETRLTGPEERADLRRRIADAVTGVLDEPPDAVELVPPRAVPKTSSGKIRRAAARDLYQSGGLGRPPRAPGWQVARLILDGIAARSRRGFDTLGALLYAVWWWTVMGGLGAVVWPLVVGLPRRQRWPLLHRVTRLALRLTRTPLQVEGREHIPDGGAVLVANHASYLDGLVLSAVLPDAPVFVAKRELMAQCVAGRFLRALDTRFVERADQEGGVRDIGAATAAARTGRSLVFFPEGTLTRRPGLLPFKLGAFRVAAQGGLPVVPVTLRGTRSILRGGQWFPRHGAVAVTIGALLVSPIPATGDVFAAAIGLRDAARAVILGRCGEPDLAPEPAADAVAPSGQGQSSRRTA